MYAVQLTLVEPIQTEGGQSSLDHLPLLLCLSLLLLLQVLGSLLHDEGLKFQVRAKVK